MSARKKTEKCSTGHILENQGSIRYHGKMSYLRFIASKKKQLKNFIVICHPPP